jgi:ribose transport system permease protein
MSRLRAAKTNSEGTEYTPMLTTTTTSKASPGPTGPPVTPPPHRGRRGKSALLLDIALKAIAAGPLFVLGALWLLFTILSPYFLTGSNLSNILIQSSSVALLALGAFVVVMVGSLDLSLGAVAGLCTLVGAVLFRDHQLGAPLVVLAMLGVALAVGVFNAFVIETLRIGNSFIVTLGTMYAVQSLSFVTSGGTQVAGVPAPLADLANAEPLGVPGPVIVVIVAAAAIAFFLDRIAWGRWIVAIGGDAEAARKVGIPVRAVLFSVYVIAALFAGLTAVLVAGLNQAGAPDSGTSILLAIAAVVIGGTSLSGGRGSVWATVIGAVILGTISNGLTLMNVSPNWTPFAIGSVLVAAVGLDAARQRLEGRLRIRQAQLQAEVI